LGPAKLERHRERLLDERGRLVREMDRIRESIPDEVQLSGRKHREASQIATIREAS